MKKLVFNIIMVLISLFTLNFALFTYMHNRFDESEMLEIPSLGICVNCERVMDDDILQDTIDKTGTAAWYKDYILDHAGQDFDGLWNIKAGDKVIFGQKEYRCIFQTEGWSDDGVRAKYGDLPEADLYLCTCLPGGEKYEIFIAGLRG